MATSGVFNGRIMVLYIQGYGVVAYSTSTSMAINGTVIDVTSKDSSLWSALLMGTKSATFTVNGLMTVDSSNNGDLLGDALLAGTAVIAKFRTHVTGDKYWYFSGYVTSLTIDAGNDSPVTYSATIQSNGQIYSVAET